MCWYKIGSKNILLFLQKYFIVLLITFTFSQYIASEEESSEENIKAKFEEIKKNQGFSCCINFKDSDMHFALNLLKKNKELEKRLEEKTKLYGENTEQLNVKEEQKKI